MKIQTVKELKIVLDEYISRLVLTDGHNPNSFKIFLSQRNWEKAKYSCTEEEKDFQFQRGVVMYKGFELKAT